MHDSGSAAVTSFFIRVSPEDVVLYANRAFSSYISVAKEKLPGTPLEVLQQFVKGEVAEVLCRPERGNAANRIVRDPDGRLFEAKTYSEGGVLDIVLDEIAADVDPSESADAVLRHPERRFVTLLSTRLCGVSGLAERADPQEVRMMLNAFVEEVEDAIADNKGTVIEITREGVTALFGAPVQYIDHALRALKTACEQLDRLNVLRNDFSHQGKEMPPCSVALASGEMLITSLSSSRIPSSTALGMASDLATRLSLLARPGEVLLTEPALHAAINTLPEGWQAIRATAEEEPDLSDLRWQSEQVVPLPEELRKAVWLIGHDVEQRTEMVEFFVRYLYGVRQSEESEAVHVLSCARPQASGAALELDDSNVVTARAARVLGKYRLIEAIGRGGMGQVWRAQDRFGNDVAIKVLNSGDSATEAQLKRFKREADVMARLPHRNICRIYEISEYEGITYIAMEYVDGLSLADLLDDLQSASESSAGSEEISALVRAIRSTRREGSAAAEISGDPDTDGNRPRESRILPVEQSLNLILRICDAVQFAHEHGVLHRDLKPGNILIREDGEPLVVDFGLAKLEADQPGISLSLSGYVVGTIENMAPEQAVSSKGVDERADVYSIGTILYQLVTGRRHFEATGNLVTDAQALQTHDPAKPRSVNRQIDPDLDAIVMKALQPEPEQRYRSVAAFRGDLERYRQGEIITAKPVTALDLLKKTVRRNKKLSLAIAACVAILLSGGIVSVVEIARSAGHAMEQAKIARAHAEDAEAQRKNAEQALLLAEMAKAEAEANEKEAMEAYQKFKKASEEALTARKAEEEARKASLAAEAKIAEQLARAEKLESERVAAERALEEAKRQAEHALAASQEPQRPGPPPRREFHEARRHLDEAMMRFHSSFSSLRIELLRRNTGKALSLIDDCIAATSRALLIDPSLAPAWLLKAKLHLACAELDLAQQALDRALAAPDGRPGHGDARDEAARLSEAIAEVRKHPLDRTGRLVAALEEAGPGNRPVAAALELLEERPPQARSDLAASPFGRRTNPEEIALAVVTETGEPYPEVSVERLPTGQGAQTPPLAVEIPSSGKMVDLSPLVGQEVARLSIPGAKGIDWQSLGKLPIQELSLPNSTLAGIPPTSDSRAYALIRDLDLSGSGITEVTALAQMNHLENLNLSGTAVADLAPLKGKKLRRLNLANTGVTDLSPLANAALQSLDLTGLEIRSLMPVLHQPLEELIFEPVLLADPISWQRLRAVRSLKVLRAPSDPEDQNPQVFWHRMTQAAVQR